MDLLAATVDASRRWYDGIFALHGLPAASDGRLWVAGDEVPPFHSAVKTLVRGVGVDAVLDAMEPHPRGSVADSFGEFDLRPHGFELLIDATWVGHPGVTGASWPSGWTVVRDADLLARWCHLHEYDGVLPPPILCGEEFQVLARLVDGVPVAGAVVHDAGRVAGQSNLWSSGDPLNPAVAAELLACAAVLHPGRPVTDYAWGDELDVLLAAGFKPLGPQRIWAR